MTGYAALLGKVIIILRSLVLDAINNSDMVEGCDPTGGTAQRLDSNGISPSDLEDGNARKGLAKTSACGSPPTQFAVAVHVANDPSGLSGRYRRIFRAVFFLLATPLVISIILANIYKRVETGMARKTSTVQILR